MKSVLTLTGAFILAYHLRRHAILKLFFFEVLVKLAKPVPVDFYFNLFKAFFQDRLANVREKPHDVIKVDGLALL